MIKKEDLKRYLISSAITFLSAFLMSLSFQISELSVEAITGSAIVGAALVAVRYAIKVLAETIIKK